MTLTVPPPNNPPTSADGANFNRDLTDIAKILNDDTAADVPVRGGLVWPNLKKWYDTAWAYVTAAVGDLTAAVASATTSAATATTQAQIAQAAGRIYASSAAGQASALASGDYFYVLTADPNLFELWQKGASTPTNTNRTAPSGAAVAANTANIIANTADISALKTVTLTQRPYYMHYRQIVAGVAAASMAAISGTYVDGTSFAASPQIRVGNGLVSRAGQLQFGAVEGVVPIAAAGVNEARRPYYLRYKQALLGSSDTALRALTASFLDGTQFGGSGGGGSYDPVAAGLLPSPDLFLVGDSMASEAFRIAIRDYFASSRSVVRVNRGGYTSDQINDVLGIDPITVASISGGQIPASGGVTLTLSTDPLYNGGAAISGGTARMTINGVEGILSTTTGATPTLTFTRSSSGSAVAVSVGAPAVLHPTNGTAAVPGTETYRSRTWLIRDGRNDLKSTPQQRIASRESMLRTVDRQIAMQRRVIIFGAYKGRAFLDGTSTQFEADGTAASDQYYEWRAMMLRDFPGIYIDAQEWACKEAIYELGLTPSSDDLTDIGLGCIPRQLFGAGDNVHTSAAMQTLEGVHFGALIKAQGY